MKGVASRLFFRWVHIICSIPIIGYIYSPFEVIPDYAPATRFVFFPSCCFRDFGYGRVIGSDGLFRTEWPERIGGMKIQ
jgi:hypothetical protein